MIKIVGQDAIETLLTNDLSSRIAVQTCQQSGLSVVYMDLLDFSGNEVYFKAEPAPRGKTYGHALLSYNDSTVIGIQHVDGAIHLHVDGVS